MAGGGRLRSLNASGYGPPVSSIWSVVSSEVGYSVTAASKVTGVTGCGNEPELAQLVTSSRRSRGRNVSRPLDHSARPVIWSKKFTVPQVAETPAE